MTKLTNLCMNQQFLHLMAAVGNAFSKFQKLSLYSAPYGNCRVEGVQFVYVYLECLSHNWVERT